MIGSQVSHYRITEKLGGGGMGVVYAAEDTRLGRSVALKFLPADLVKDQQALQRFHREARTASSLNHSHICTIYEIDDHDGQPFIAMELLKGMALNVRIAGKAIPIDTVLDWAIQICDALETAHARGIVHRDIKPGNIFITERNQAKVLDFGLAKLEPGRGGVSDPTDETLGPVASHLTSPGSAVGTVAYMSPEQARGEATDARTDLFSLAGVLYEMATGVMPFQGTTSAVIFDAILHRRPTSPLRMNPEVPAELERIIEKGLEKDRDLRYQNAAGILVDLKRLKRDRDSGQTSGAMSGSRNAAGSDERSVAVLYFENLGGGGEDEYFRDGMTEDVITELLKIKKLRVFPRSAVYPFRDRRLGAAQVGQQLDAAYVLDGTLRRAGTRLRVTAQLVDTRLGQAIWAERFDRQIEDVFAIQDEIAQSIANALEVVLTEGEKRALEKVQTHNVEAYDFYLRGRQFFYQVRRKSLEAARKMFARAIEIDANYARAHAGLADACSCLYIFWEATQETLQQAKAASEKALALDPDLAEAHVSRGLAVSLDQQFEEAEREFQSAIKMDSALFEAFYLYGRACFAQGKLAQAAELFERASKARPEDYQAPNLLGLSYDGMRKRAAADGAYRRCVEAVEKQLQLNAEDERALYLGAQALCRIGDRDRGLQWADRAVAIDPDEPAVLYNVACAYALAGRQEKAIELLEKAVQKGFGYKEWIDSDPALDSLRTHPRFDEVVGQGHTRSSSA